MSPKPKCLTCKFWVSEPAEAGPSVFGQCRRMPPVYVSERSLQFPFTKPDMWCGEHRLIEEPKRTDKGDDR